MTRFLWDENTNHHILRGLRRVRVDLDIVTIQQLGLTGADDDLVLDRAAKDDRVLVTHDRASILARIAARRETGRAIPGVVITKKDAPVGSVIDALLFLVDVALPDDWSFPLFIP